MDVKAMTNEDLEARKAALAAEGEEKKNDASALDIITEELRAINAEIEERKALAKKQAELRAAVAAGAGEVIEKAEQPKQERKMDLKEIRSSKAYIDAYANYIKTGDDTECRALLTVNAEEDGTIPVPVVVEGYIRNAWERNGFLALVRRIFVRGNYTVGFEISSTGATVHLEGGDPIDPEELVIGTVTLIPASIKKLVQVSDEALDMGGEEFLAYIYDEIANKIATEVADQLIGAIIAAPATSGAQGPAVPVYTTASLALDTIAQANALLKASARPVIVMNRGTHAAFRSLQLGAYYGVDPYEGMDVYYTNALKSFADADEDDTVIIVGDFAEGALLNFPRGEEITFKFDDRTNMAADLVNVLGREYVALGVVSPYAFAKVVKGSESE